MKITLCKTADENIRIKKTVTDKFDIEGCLLGECSILSPTIEIETELNLSSFNYAIIEAFNRCYFITDITVMYNKMWKISLKCDVLTTYSVDILNLQANILRNPDRCNLMLEDNQLNIYADDRVQCINFPNSLTSTSNNQFKYYLAVIGGN